MLKHAFIAIGVTMVAACARNPDPLVLSGPTMGTTYTIRVAGPASLPAPSIVRERIEAELTRIDAMASRYRNDSEVARFNADPTLEWVPVSPALARLVDQALQLHRKSRGAFDVGIAPVIDLWGFGPQTGEPRVPDAQAMRNAQRSSGAKHIDVRLQPAALRKHVQGVAIDLNAIAPGYAVDQLAELLESLGARDYLVELGGELRVRGHNERGVPWRIAIEDPRSPVPTPYAFITPGDAAVATSGGYRHHFEADGQRYSHVIDGRSGAPASAELAAVIVIAPSAAEADGWATALYALGAAVGFDVAEENQLAVLFLRHEGAQLEESMTAGFAHHRAR
jgi:thiamine biosynthesis lipoprotein